MKISIILGTRPEIIKMSQLRNKGIGESKILEQFKMKLNTFKHFPKDLALVILFTFLCIQTFS